MISDCTNPVVFRLAADGDHRSSVGRRYGSTDRPDDLLSWDIEASAAEVCQSAGTMLRADYVEAGQMPVVLANRFGGVIFHEACGHLWKPRRSNGAQPPLPTRWVNPSPMHQSPPLMKDSAAVLSVLLSMDDEGMEPQRTVLIKDGVLQRFISDRAGNFAPAINAPEVDVARAIPLQPPADAQHLHRCWAAYP